MLRTVRPPSHLAEKQSPGDRTMLCCLTISELSLHLTHPSTEGVCEGMHTWRIRATRSHTRAVLSVFSTKACAEHTRGGSDAFRHFHSSTLCRRHL